MSGFVGGERAIALMEDVAVGDVAVWDMTPESLTKVAGLMRDYSELPMDLADASLVLLSESLGHGRILTTDQRDFRTYRWKTRRPFVCLLD